MRFKAQALSAALFPQCHYYATSVWRSSCRAVLKLTCWHTPTNLWLCTCSTADRVIAIFNNTEDTDQWEVCVFHTEWNQNIWRLPVACVPHMTIKWASLCVGGTISDELLSWGTRFTLCAHISLRVFKVIGNQYQYSDRMKRTQPGTQHLPLIKDLHCYIHGDGWRTARFRRPLLSVRDSDQLKPSICKAVHYCLFRCCKVLPTSLWLQLIGESWPLNCGISLGCLPGDKWPLTHIRMHAFKPVSRWLLAQIRGEIWWFSLQGIWLSCDEPWLSLWVCTSLFFIDLLHLKYFSCSLPYMLKFTRAAIRGRLRWGVNSLHRSKYKQISFAQGLFVCVIITLSHQWYDRVFVVLSGLVHCSSINTSVLTHLCALFRDSGLETEMENVCHAR